MIDAATVNAPNWVDLSTPDIVGATEFYKRLLGWDVAVMPSTMGDYYVGKVGNADVAGMMAQAPEMAGTPPVWTVFFYVEDIDKTIELVETHGGTVVTRPFEIPGGARVGVAVDPTGAMFALITGGATPEGEYFNTTPGAVCWVELMTQDPDAATRFYREVFGWETVVDTPDGTVYTTFTLDGAEVAGMIPMPAEVPEAATSDWSVYFTVEDCATTCALATDLGGSVLRPPMAIPIGAFAVASDPLGAVFQIMELSLPAG